MANLPLRVLAPFAFLAIGWSGARWISAAGGSAAGGDFSEIEDSPRREHVRTASRLPAIAPEVLEDVASLDFTFAAPYEASFAEILRNYDEEGFKGPAKLVIALDTWLTEDRDACLEFLAKQWPGGRRISEAAMGIVVEHAARLSDAALLAFVSVFRLAGLPESPLPLLQIAAERAWSSGPDAITAYSETLPIELRRGFIQQASGTCPEIHREAWAARLIKLEDISSLRKLVLLDKQSAKPWIKKLMSENPQTALMFELNGIHALVKYQPDEGSSLEQTLNELVARNPSDQNPGEVRERELTALTLARTADAREKLATTHRHLLDQYMEGALNTEQLLKSLSGDLTELAQANPAAMRKELLHVLAAANPQAAMAWISDLPPEEKHKAVHDTVGRFSNPEQRIALLAAYPYENSQGPLQRRYMLMAGMTSPSYQEYGNSYAEWLISLPMGLDRKMALSALSHDLRHLDPDLSKRLSPGQ